MLASPPLPAAQAGTDALLQNLLDASATGIAQLEPVYAAGQPPELVDFVYVRLNPAAQRMLGLPEYPVGSLRSLAARAADFAFYHHTFLSDQPGHCLLSSTTAAGHPTTLRVAAQRNGPHLVVSFTEVSAPHHPAGAPALAQETQVLRQVFAQTPAAIGLLYGPEHRFEYVNPAFQKLFPGRVLAGRPAADAFPELLAQGLTDVLGRVYQSGQASAGVEVPLAVAQLPEALAQYQYFNFICQAHPENGEPARLSVFANDVTKQVLARRQRKVQWAEWQFFFEQAPVAITVLRGPQHIVELANPAIRALWGRTLEQVLERPLFEAIPEMASHEFEQILADVLATGQPHVAFEQPSVLSSPGQDQKYLNFVYQPLFESNGQIIGVVVVVADATEQVQSRQHVQQLNEELRVLNEQLTAANEGLRANNYELAYTQQQLRLLNQELECRVATGVRDAQQARDAAEQQRQRLARFFQQAPAAICVLDGPDLVYELVNPGYQKFFPGRDLLGRPMHEAVPELVHQPIYQWLRQVYATGVTHEGHEVPLPVPLTGAPPVAAHYFNCVYQARQDSQGCIDGVLVFALDVTEQVQAQQHVAALQAEAQAAAEHRAQERETFYQIFEHSPAIVSLMWGPTHKFAYVNHSFQRLFPGRTLLNLPLAEALPETVEQGFVGLLDHVYQTGESYVAKEVPLTVAQPDGQATQQLYLNLAYQPYRDNDHTLGVSVFAYDVTEQVLDRQRADQAFRELRTSNEQLTRTNADLDTFIYTASHDLKSPIANIEGLLLLLRKQLPAEARQAGLVPRVLDMMQAAIERFQLTITQLTDLAKLQHAHTQPAEEVNLPAVVEAVRLDLALLLAEAHAQLVINLDSCATVSFAPQHLRSIIYNLLSNAIKYRHPARPLVVQMRCLRADTATTLQVQDNGLGLTPEQQGKLFGMFRRLHDHVPGSGVGLYMVKRIVENAGGTISVQSQPELGSTFTVSFPS